MSETKKEKKLSFFTFLTSINEGKRGKNLLADCNADISEAALPDSPDKFYLPFMVNRGLSFFMDTVLYANEMNRYTILPVKMQYDFLKMCMPPRRRFSKWAKKIDDTEDVKLIMERYDYSAEKARDALRVLTKNQIAIIKSEMDKGGCGKTKKKTK